MSPKIQQIVGPGALVYDEQRRNKLGRYKEAVRRAGFLSNRDKENWYLLAHIMTTDQLREGEQIIINEDLRRLRIKYKLEKIKPNKEK